MDVTASTITIVSSVWTLTIYCKRLIQGAKNSEERIKELERKAKTFATVIGHVDNAYGWEATGPDKFSVEPDEIKIWKDVQNEVSRCEEDLKGYEKEVLKLLEQRRTAKFGVGRILNKWNEEVANPTLGKIEKSIADHQSYLQSLMEVHHVHRLQETRKDLKQVLTAIDRMFDKIEDLARSQGLNEQDSSIANELDHSQRRGSDAPLVDLLEDTDGEKGTTIEGEGSNSLHARAQDLFRELLNLMGLKKGLISLPSGQPQSLLDPSMNEQNALSEMATSQGSEFSDPQPTDHDEASGQMRKPSFKRKSLSSSPTQMSGEAMQPLHTSSDTPSFSGSPKTTMRTSGSPISVQITSSECIDSAGNAESVAKEKGPHQPLDEGLQSCMEKDKGSELLQAITSGSGEAFQSLLRSDRSLEERDEKGKTPLILAASLGKVDMVEKLLARGANMQAVDNKQAGALHSAVESCSWSVMSLLLKFRDTSHNAPISQVGDIEIDLPDKDGRTPLHYCTFFGCAEDGMRGAAEELIAHKADIDARDKSKKPPVYYAIKNRRDSVVKLFLEQRADLDFETSPEIGKLLDNHLASHELSPTMNKGKTRRDSTRS